MKNLMLEHRLAAVQERVAPDLMKIADEYYKTPLRQQTIAVMRARLDHRIELELRADGIDIARHVLVEADTLGRVKIHASVPAWDHDCRACEFLGRWDFSAAGPDDRRSRFDLYTCTVHTITPRCFVARYGDDGPDYTSAPASSLEMTRYFHPALYEALRRWRLTP